MHIHKHYNTRREYWADTLAWATYCTTVTAWLAYMLYLLLGT